MRVAAAPSARMNAAYSARARARSIFFDGLTPQNTSQCCIGSHSGPCNSGSGQCADVRASEPERLSQSDGHDVHLNHSLTASPAVCQLSWLMGGLSCTRCTSGTLARPCMASGGTGPLVPLTHVTSAPNRARRRPKLSNGPSEMRVQLVTCRVRRHVASRRLSHTPSVMLEHEDRSRTCNRTARQVCGCDTITGRRSLTWISLLCCISVAIPRVDAVQPATLIHLSSYARSW